MAWDKIAKLSKALEEIRNKCQKSRYQLNVNVGLIFLGCTFDLLNVASMISLIDDLAKTYNISYTTASWSLTSYAVTFAGFIACMGRLGDIIGNSVLFTISCSCFAVLSLLCAVMPNFPAFAVFRAIQGICAAGLVPCAYALIPILAPKEKVQKYFSIVSCGFSSTIGLGLIIGGAFATTKIGYRGIFYLTFAVMTLISIIAFFFTYGVEKLNKKPQKDQASTSVISLDFIGSLIFVAGSILIVVGLTEGGESWNRPVTYVTLVIGIILFFGFFVWNCTYTKIVRGFEYCGIDTSKYFEKVQLLIPIDVLFMKNFIPIVLAFALNNACLFSCLYIIDQYSQYAERNSPLLAGVKLVPLIICMVIGNALCAFESTKLRPRVGVAIGFFLALAGSIILIQLHLVKENLFWKIFFSAQALVGFGVAIFYPYALQIAVGGAPDESKGIASGVAQTFGQLGIEITFSVLASVLGNINEMKGKSNAIQKFRTGFQNCSYFTVAVGALGFLVTAICIRDIPPLNDDMSDLESSIHRTKVEFDREKDGSEEES
ncbi:YMR279C-like protein [Saccharomyces cerevisiae x Saccharomyces kudriavzevii VIN7]|uniref:YMR279C-like protein n=1 Tax=Saccharomyces cerevisiae x Saccharomyces kudriavzevii (strain VIN7) TaxID=1095631 RepID=H0GU74_SACCK|nr:YMR279C-like protein [Saccharomyces cerevisiae x Saccharomyces kudriavzevii VIN7]CAI5264798.1 AIS_HP2_G0015710.mRNA.1.CDS.1 [Saccharomyces cerevisiae]CAI6483697.1 AIS_HP2_G0015710.mRNA.1.CDS.1 [Saccharomyces cerevisiae]